MEGEEGGEVEEMMGGWGESRVGVIGEEEIEGESGVGLDVFGGGWGRMLGMGVGIEVKGVGYKFEKVEMGGVGGGML